MYLLIAAAAVAVDSLHEKVPLKVLYLLDSYLW